MAVKTHFPLFAPPPLHPDPHRPITEIRFSRWNNANAQKFVIPKRAQKQLEDQIRLDKRFDSALNIAHNFGPNPPPPPTFKSAGTPSAPSSPSIPGKKSKYSKPPKQLQSPRKTHPAFEPLSKPQKFPVNEDTSQISQFPAAPSFQIDENGVSYEMPDAPFLYQYSYTETPKVKPVKLREPLVSPFGPTTMAKPWLGRKPLPPSKKKLPEFDSFQLPPPHKKGVKPVQAPGPFLPGSGPKYVRSREEVLGEPLSKEEIEDLINSCKKSSRQLNIGRDGLTHNMLDNIHALWKRRRVCKIKCKGVCTVDMNNVCEQLEEKTGGKIIFNRGGVVYLFRGRNYNYRSRPRFPLMLWKPITPVYPRLVKRVPEGLTLEEATEMRKKGRDLIPICKLAKNGVYCNLVKDVREAFEACELVRINCQGLNPSDYRRIGAKLKDLVPCVLLSFEFEHILIWRGRDWKSSLTEPNESSVGLPEVDSKELVALPSSSQSSSSMESNYFSHETDSLSTCSNEESQGRDEFVEVGADILSKADDAPIVASHTVTNVDGIDESDGSCVFPVSSHNHTAVNGTVERETVLESSVELQTRMENRGGASENFSSVALQPLEESTATENDDQRVKFTMPSDEGILLLRKQAIENGMALMLPGRCFDADIVFKEAAAFAKTAPPGPVFRHRPRKSATPETKEQESDNLMPKEAQAPTGLHTETTAANQRPERKSPRTSKMKDIKAEYLNQVPKGNLRVDELAKLLS